MPDVSQAAGRAAERPAGRDLREVIRDEHLMRRRILEVLGEGPLTIPEIAEALERPSHEVLLWVMGMRKYGHVAEIKEATDEGFYQYQAVKREEA
ncbi:MAG: MarR family transcriptional regulator [Actinobacteria bacterium]|nr:MarR family transcriptional regulator [Actinomycetota bacterium]